MHTETKSTPPDTESLSPNVEILSEQMKEVQQKLAENLYVAATSEFCSSVRRSWVCRSQAASMYIPCAAPTRTHRLFAGANVW